MIVKDLNNSYGRLLIKKELNKIIEKTEQTNEEKDSIVTLV